MDLADILIQIIEGIGDFFAPGFDYRLAQVSDYSPGSGVRSVIGVVKVISGTVSVAALAVLAFAAVKLRALNAPQPAIFDEFAPPESAQGPMGARWEEIMRHLESTKEAEWKFSVIEADKLVDLVLTRAGFPGATLGERLTNIQPGQLETLEGLWEAHKVRNRLAHDLNYFLRYTEAKQAIEQYARTLRELQAI